MNNEIRQILFLDYDKTLAFIDKADGQLFQIRNWAIVSCSAVVAFAVSQKIPIILAANAFLVICFLFLELIYKSFHEDCLGKGHYLEVLIKQSLDPSFKLPTEYQFGIGHEIKAPKLRKMFKILFSCERWHICAVYLGLIIVTALAAVYLLKVA
jgi:hypothetical protein